MACKLCGRAVRPWFANTDGVPGWKCMACERFFCDACAPQDGTGAHDETACWYRRLRLIAAEAAR